MRFRFALPVFLLLLAGAPLKAGTIIQLLAPAFGGGYDGTTYARGFGINDMDIAVGTAFAVEGGQDEFTVTWNLNGVTSGSVVGQTLFNNWAEGGWYPVALGANGDIAVYDPGITAGNTFGPPCLVAPCNPLAMGNSAYVVYHHNPVDLTDVYGVHDLLYGNQELIGPDGASNPLFIQLLNSFGGGGIQNYGTPSLNSACSDCGAYVDIPSAVPEPSSTILLATIVGISVTSARIRNSIRGRTHRL